VAHVEQNKTLCIFSGVKWILTNLVHLWKAIAFARSTDCDWLQWSAPEKQRVLKHQREQLKAASLSG